MPRSALSAVPGIALLIGCLACHRQPAVAHVVEPVPVTREELVTELTPQETAALSPRAARIIVGPDSVTIAPGEVYSYAQLRVVVLDSSGNALGRLRVFDVSLTPGAAALATGRQVRGIYPGRGEMWIRFPPALWSGGGTAPPAIPLPIIVRAPGTGAAHPPSPNDR